nr:MAG TPA: hypothetical protein [Caudoviricetes sp.]
MVYCFITIFASERKLIPICCRNTRGRFHFPIWYGLILFRGWEVRI